MTDIERRRAHQQHHSHFSQGWAKPERLNRLLTSSLTALLKNGKRIEGDCRCRLAKTVETERLNPGIWKVTSVAVLGSFLAQTRRDRRQRVSLKSCRGSCTAAFRRFSGSRVAISLHLCVMLPLNGWMVGSHRSQGSLFVVFHGFHALLSVVRDGMVCEFPHRILESLFQGMEWRRSTFAPMGADDDGRASRESYDGRASWAGPLCLSCWGANPSGPVIAGASILQYASLARWLFS